ncbi:MAG: nucleotide exchange factor GrpE [Erysipelotrichaceae bacterium]|nr:nucleotide exchange factor GrpE [Erysipelotrichaceae bacterium]
MEKKETVNEKAAEMKKKRTATASKAKKNETSNPKAEEVKASKEEEKIKALEDEVKQLKEELATSKNAYFKAYADADNMKKRLQAESENVRKYRIQSFASEVLPVIDSLERALAVTVEDEAVVNYVKGFEMIYTQLKSILEKEGVTEIEALEKPFDPNYHNALMQEKVEDVESGIVLEVLQKGYMLKDRVLRAALVKVSE